MKILKESKHRYVYDDTHFSDAEEFIYDQLEYLQKHPDMVSEYEYGWTAKAYRIKDFIEYVGDKDYGSFLGGIEFLEPTHAYGIGNNNEYEIVVQDYDSKEKQICGLLHITEDLVGNALCFMTDIDGGNKTQTIKIIGSKR